MQEPTATNAQGEKVVFRGGQWVPMGGGQQPAPQGNAFPGVIQGRPKAADPTKERDFNYDVTQDLVQNEQSLRKEFYSLPAVKEYQVAARTYANSLQAADDASGDQSLIVAYAKMLDPNSVVREGEAAAVAGTDSTIGRSIAAISKELGLDSGGSLSPDIRKKIRREMRTLAENYGAAYGQERAQFSDYASSYGFDPNRVVGRDVMDPYRQTIDDYWAKQEVPAQEGAGGPYWKDESGNPVFDQDGNPLGPDGGVGYDAQGNELGLFAGVTDDSPNVYDQEIAKQSAEQDELRGTPGFFDIAKSGMTFGLSDEAAGVGQAVAGILTGNLDVTENYQRGRDIERNRIDRAREAMGTVPALATEIVSSGGGVASLPGKAFGIAEGAGVGALGGFSYGEGFEGSTSNALIGGLAGGAIARGGQIIGNALARRPASTVNAAEVARAGNAEGVTVNRVMVDPKATNQMTRIDASKGGGGTVQRGMRDIEGQIEGRVSNLGRGGQAMDDIATGDKIKAASERFIDKSGKAAKAKYDRAEKLAGNAKVAPKQSLAIADEMIGKLGGTKDTGILDAQGNPITRVVDGSGLSETASTNSSEITFLKGIREDLSKDLSVGALRRMRTSLRKKISKGELVFGEDEARVLSIMDAAADDIATGLAAQGKEGAARAFRAADTAYRARMDYITNTVQKVIGKRGANLSSEQIASKFNSLSRNDARGLKRLYATLGPDEAADVAATFADRLGKNNKGDFSVAHFLSQTEKMSDEAIRTVFGAQGAESVKNLRILGKEVNRVTSSMNSRTSKSGVAMGGDYRGWLMQTLLGGGLGYGSSGNVEGALIGAAAGAGARRGLDFMSARALMSPKITKWITQAPKTANPKAIDAHFAKLSVIAKAEPAIAAEVDSIRKGIMSAANDNVGVTAAADEPSQ